MVDQHAGDRVGQQLADAAVALPAHAQRVLRVEPSGRPRRRGQLLDRHLQRGRHLVEHGERRVAGAGLDVAPGRPRQLREPRHLLLREAARLAQLAHVLAEPGRERVAHGKTIARCQCIGNPVGLLAARRRSCIWRRFHAAHRKRGARHRREPRARRRRWPRSWRGAARGSSPWRARPRRSSPWWPGSARTGFEAHALVADQGDKDAVYPLVGAATALVGPIDLLVLNASTLGPLPLRELADTECEDFARVLEVNLLGPFRLTKAVVGSMVVRGAGLVVGLSSDAAVERLSRLGRLRRVEGRARPPAPDLGRGARRQRRPLPEHRSRRDGHAHARRRDAGGRSRAARRSRARSPRGSCGSSKPAVPPAERHRGSKCRGLESAA